MNKTQFERDGNRLILKRSFNAPISSVWRAWTEAELLDQWWAPKPWKSETSHMEFKVGGCRLYAMVGPEGEKHIGRTDYRSIDFLTLFSGEDAFCDENGHVNSSLPIAKFQNEFSSISENTLVTVTTEYASEESLQQVIDMGMKEGLNMAYENLDKVLKNLISK